jgi:hypothetical protein
MKATFEWKTGTPKHTGKYLITDKYGNIDVDHWFDATYKSNRFGKDSIGWDRHYDEDVMAWCELIDIPSYPNKPI